MAYLVAADTFVTDLPGRGVVMKGTLLHDTDPVVALDGGRNVLFQPADASALIGGQSNA